MRISLLIPSLAGGGAERMFVSTANRLAEQGHKIDLVLMTSSDAQYVLDLSSAVRIVDLRRPRLWTSPPALRQYIVRERPDVVISAMPLANAIAASVLHTVIHRPILILTEHSAVSLAFGDCNTPRYWPLMQIIRHSYQLADAVVGVSKGVADRVRQMPGVRSDNVHSIYNPVWRPEIAVRAMEPPVGSFPDEKGNPVVIAAGRLEPVKDFHTLLKAFALLRHSRKASLVILGEGSLRGDLERHARDLNISQDLMMPGFVENPWAYFSRSDVFVLSSTHEGFGNVLVEAMACGTPVVSTDCPSGPAEVLEGGRYGSLVAAGDYVAMAAAIGAMIDCPTPAEALRARATEFSVEAAVDAYLELLDSVTARRRGKP